MANWIAGAIKKPGAFTAQAKKDGAVTKQGAIKLAYEKAVAKRGGVAGRRARLAMTLRKLGK